MRRTFAVIAIATIIAPIGGYSGGSSATLNEFPIDDVVTIDFDSKIPDRHFYRSGGRLEVVDDPGINETRMGIITLFPQPQVRLGAIYRRVPLWLITEVSSAIQ